MTQDEPNNEAQSRLQQLAEFAKRNGLPLVTTSILGAIAVASGGDSTLLSPEILGAINLTSASLFEHAIGRMADGDGDTQAIVTEMEKLLNESRINDAMTSSEFQIAIGRLMREQRHIRYILKHSDNDLRDQLIEQLEQFGSLYEQLQGDIVESLRSLHQKTDVQTRILLDIQSKIQFPQLAQPMIKAGKVTGQIDRRYAMPICKR